ncbi:dynein heavy chain axonemal [Paramuricea clavata]|uniref:Dynein heavy chain axonemal n=1 Tax=Paramuricea clavata TaxID=317549 RepID=A0A6S7FVQ3_PARCT|nr:dynein heavy chain axonemal [Paramuricea clavata]
MRSGRTTVDLLGDTISAQGLKPVQRKVEAIQNMERPGNKTDLQRFLGMINSLARYIPDLSTRTMPLRKLLDQNVLWMWNNKQEKAWKELKELVSSEPVLKFYDPNKPIKISTDASRSGLGAVLQQLHGENWLPVAYASRSVTDCESRYATIELETLGMTFSCDSLPRIQRLRLRLQKYDFKLLYVPGKWMHTPDALSRAPLKLATHQGREKCKQRAGQVVFWPGFNSDIDNIVESCETCQQHQHNHQKEPLKPYPVPTRPWQVVGTDLCEINKKEYLVIVDAYSSYPEVIPLSSQSSKAVIKVEKAVQTVKNIINKSIESGTDPYLGLLAYRSTPLDKHKSPAELLMGRTLETDLPVVDNQLNVKDSKAVVAWKTKKKEIQKSYHDREAKPFPPLKQVETKDKVQYRRNRKQLRKITSEVEDGNDKSASTTKRAEKQVETKSLPSNEVSRDISRYGRTIKKPRRFEQHT